MSVTVYRLEDRVNGWGPYDGLYNKLVRAEDNLETDENGFTIFPEGREGFPSFYADEQRDAHPGPIRDGLDGFPWGWIFGFESEQAMKDWFFRDEMDAERLDFWGMEVVVFEVENDAVMYGGKQLAFDRSESVEIKVLSPIEFKGA